MTIALVCACNTVDRDVWLYLTLVQTLDSCHPCMPCAHCLRPPFHQELILLSNIGFLGVTLQSLKSTFYGSSPRAACRQRTLFLEFEDPRRGVNSSDRGIGLWKCSCSSYDAFYFILSESIARRSPSYPLFDFCFVWVPNLTGAKPG